MRVPVADQDPTVPDQDAVLAFLACPGAHGQPEGTSVERVDTHISAVFLAGASAIKAKRPVALPYVDFSTVARRRAACAEEVRLNRRTAADLYLGVGAVVVDHDGGISLLPPETDGAPDRGEPVVIMRRFDRDKQFDRLADTGRLDADTITRLAERIAGFHAEAEIVDQPPGGADRMAAIIHGDREMIERFTPAVFRGDRSRLLADRLDALLAAHRRRLDARQADGRVRVCHGDMHLRNICLWRGVPALFDAIEFNPAFARIDVAYDLAFLVMDLAERGLPGLAGLVVNRTLDHGGDWSCGPLLPMFCAVRAGIRAHVTAATAASSSDPHSARDLTAQAQRYLDLAVDFARPAQPRLVAVGGLSGSGKSRLARAIAPFIGGMPGAVVLRSDVLRKHMHGVALTDRLPPESYTREASRRVYMRIHELAADLLGAGCPVVADAVFAGPQERQDIAALARSLHVPFDGIWLHADPQVMAERIARRHGNASDATPEVLARQLGYDTGPIEWTRIDSGGNKSATVAAAAHALGLDPIIESGRA